jgi:hypothetical protein
MPSSRAEPGDPALVTPPAELARTVGARLARAARTIAPVTIPVAAWWIAAGRDGSCPRARSCHGRPRAGGLAAIVIRWAEATVYGPDEHAV